MKTRIEPAKRSPAKPARWAVLRTVLANPGMLRVRPSVSFALLGYMGKFRAKNVGGNLILHSHMPPLNGKAYSRFVKEHLRGRTAGPSHAQVGVTNACPQRCAYCYNRDRAGKPMDTATILRVVDDLVSLGVFWIGLTGGEPLLQKDLETIVERAAARSAVKIFTTGFGLTAARAAALRRAGLFSVAVSLDHWREDIHDAARGYPGAFRDALRALEIFGKTPGLHTSVSAVLSRDMIQRGETAEFLQFLEGTGVDEAWLSEVKPSAAPFWNEDVLASGEERRRLIALQDEYNRAGRMTVNYLGHFEGPAHFGCNAGRRMVYVDAFGDVSPCVFAPMTFGNVRERPAADIVADMGKRFRPSDSCFVRTNYPLFAKYAATGLPLGPEVSSRIADEAVFGAPAELVRRIERI